ncbi:MAG: PRC-barrel domain-containing protein [Candidatus Abawacabacteria bacterium]|nr:PRC-barrel domain-containing protein [Candidatus Abawacabacteria bacterium]
MKKNYSTTFHLPVISVATETIIALPYQFIIEWQNFQIVALWVRFGLTHKKIILWQDIQEISNGWYVQSESALSEASDLIRLQEVLARFFNLKGAHCKTLDGVMLGKVSDFTFDMNTGQITQIMIKNYLLKPIAHELIIPLSAINKVENETIFVDDLEKKVETEQTSPVILPATNYV